jgi:hypothetical protein
MTTERPFEGGPYLTAALLCEKVLVEQDGVKSAIRIVDRVMRQVVGPNPPARMEPFEHELFFLISFKSGRARGTSQLKVQLIRPSLETGTAISCPLLFEGEDDRGTEMIIQTRIKIEQPGLYWFYVYLDDYLITKIPLRVVYMPQAIQTQTGPAPLPPASET